MKNTRLLLIPFFSLTCLLAFGQSYKTAAGIRLDNGINFTLQQHIVNNWTAEAILHTPLNSNELGLTVLAEKHQKILFRGLNMYAGAGGHYYWQSAANRSESGALRENVYGLSFIGGAEITLGKFNVSFDWKPELHLAGDQIHPFEWTGGSISVRYVLAKRERRKVRDWKVWDNFGGNKDSNKNNKNRRR
ncbi:MAG: hypothetical protein KIS77_16660 [Saprospiraceae bacterium]|nr:hypothetical protein [Saprospiraceae bacterium]